MTHTPALSEASEPDVRPAHAPGSRLTSIALGVLLVAALALIGYLSYLQPLRADDFSNLNIMQSNPVLGSYVEYWYTTWTGRATGMVALWLGLSSKAGFAIANTLAFGLLAWLTLAVASAQRPRLRTRDLSLLGLLVAAYWFSFPAISETVFWTTGATAYLWATVLMLASIAPYRIWHARWSAGDAQPVPLARAIPAAAGLAVLGLATGASQEQVAVVLVISAALLLAALVRRRQLGTLPVPLWAGLAGLALGIAVQVLSPGNAVRSAMTPVDAMSIAERLEAFVQYAIAVFDMYVYPVFGWVLACAAIALLATPRNGQAADRRSVWWLWAGCAAATIGLFIAQPRIANLAGARTTVFAASLLLIAGLSPLASAAASWSDRRAPRVVSSLAMALLALTIASTAHSVSHARKLGAELDQREAFIEQQLAAGVEDVVVTPVETQSTRALMFHDITRDPGYWTNQAAAQYFGVKTLRLSETAE